MSNPLLAVLICTAILTLFCLAWYVKAHLDCNPELQSITGITTLFFLALLIAIVILAMHTTEHCPNCDAVVTTP